MEERSFCDFWDLESTCLLTGTSSHCTNVLHTVLIVVFTLLKLPLKTQSFYLILCVIDILKHLRSTSNSKLFVCYVHLKICYSILEIWNLKTSVDI